MPRGLDKQGRLGMEIGQPVRGCGGHYGSFVSYLEGTNKQRALVMFDGAKHATPVFTFTVRPVRHNVGGGIGSLYYGTTCNAHETPVPGTGGGLSNPRYTSLVLRQYGKKVEQHVSPPGWKGTVKKMKKHEEITNPFALAWYMKKKGAKPHGNGKGESHDHLFDTPEERERQIREATEKAEKIAIQGKIVRKTKGKGGKAKCEPAGDTQTEKLGRHREERPREPTPGHYTKAEKESPGEEHWESLQRAKRRVRSRVKPGEEEGPHAEGGVGLAGVGKAGTRASKGHKPGSRTGKLVGKTSGTRKAKTPAGEEPKETHGIMGKVGATIGKATRSVVGESALFPSKGVQAAAKKQTARGVKGSSGGAVSAADIRRSKAWQKAPMPKGQPNVTRTVSHKEIKAQTPKTKWSETPAGTLAKGVATVAKKVGGVITKGAESYRKGARAGKLRRQEKRTAKLGEKAEKAEGKARWNRVFEAGARREHKEAARIATAKEAAAWSKKKTSRLQKEKKRMGMKSFRLYRGANATVTKKLLASGVAKPVVEPHPSKWKPKLKPKNWSPHKEKPSKSKIKRHPPSLIGWGIPT